MWYVEKKKSINNIFYPEQYISMRENYSNMLKIGLDSQLSYSNMSAWCFAPIKLITLNQYTLNTI